MMIVVSDYSRRVSDG